MQEKCGVRATSLRHYLHTAAASHAATALAAVTSSAASAATLTTVDLIDDADRTNFVTFQALVQNNPPDYTEDGVRVQQINGRLAHPQSARPAGAE